MACQEEEGEGVSSPASPRSPFAWVGETIKAKGRYNADCRLGQNGQVEIWRHPARDILHFPQQCYNYYILATTCFIGKALVALRVKDASGWGRKNQLCTRLRGCINAKSIFSSEFRINKSNKQSTIRVIFQKIQCCVNFAKLHWIAHLATTLKL